MMKRTQKFGVVILLLAAALTIFGLWSTREAADSSSSRRHQSSSAGIASQNALVDQSPLKTAQQLAQLATTAQERVFAQEALRLADFEVELAFSAALHQALLHPPALSAEARAIQDRLQKAEKLLKADQERAKQLTGQIAKLPDSKKEAAQLDLIQAQADMDLDQDEVDDAKEDLIEAGGNLTDRIQAMRKEHEDADHVTASAIPTGAPPSESGGMIHRAQQWSGLHQKQTQLKEAKAQAEASMSALAAAHALLDAKLEAAKEISPELAHHSKKSTVDIPAARVSGATKNREESEALLKKTRQIAEDQKTLSTFDKQREEQKELAIVYGQWIDFVSRQQRRVISRMLLGLLIILSIAIVGVYFSSWMDSLVGRLKMDRRQIQSLHTVTRVTLQVLGVMLILLVIFGPPSQIGTFLGLAGAGLTVALKDFIVGFLGWFVLMGKNGIRLGDWVEINGVTGEVVQIGPFHTVLLETGNWTDSGHPTGRRVTFTNSFAIEGHYFNFSTSGQWLWDELQVVLPTGQDPYPTIEALRKRVMEETVKTAQQAEEEWRGSISSQEMSSFSAAPAISVKPVLGGVEVAVRYITRANDRYNLRSKLNQAAVELLGGRPAEIKTPPAPAT